MDPEIPAAARARIGRVSEHVYEVTRKDIKRYAQAIDDPNPLYWNDEFAQKTRWQGIIAPPLFCHTLAFEDVPASELRPDGLPTELDLPLPTTRTVGGASVFETGEPVRPGDVITVTKVIEDIYRKTGKSGEMFFVVLAMTFVNQNKVVVARERATFIQR